MADRNSLTQARLRELLHYDPLTGIFTWLVNKGPQRKAGDIAGCLHKRSGYWAIVISGCFYLRSRLAWFYMHGVWPDPECDHINTVLTDDWIDNLRPATRLQNQQNQRDAHANGASGHLGVHWSTRHNCWIARITLEGRTKQLGLFDDPHEGHLRYLEAKATMHPFAVPPRA